MHNFFTQIAENTLQLFKFTSYLKQDMIFLRAFCDLVSVASTIAHDRQTKLLFEGLIESTSQYEIPMQNEILNMLDKNYVESAVNPEVVTGEYIRYINSVCDSGDLALILSAMAPCPWTYYEISNKLIRKNIKSEEIKKWLVFYSSKNSRKQIDQIKELLDKLASNADEAKKTDMKRHFSSSCNYEIKFWDMAYSFYY